MRRIFVGILAAITSIHSATHEANAIDPLVEQALKIQPMQSGIDYETPASSQAENCTIKSEKSGRGNARVLYSPDGNVLRKFIDSNNDGTIDRWCYSKNGIEVYRDIDADFNGRADQYRWFGTAGTRWGIDDNEDGKIDSWKWISAEEVTLELIHALRSKNENQFKRLLISKREIESLELSESVESNLQDRLNSALVQFKELASTIDKQTEWVDFSAPYPGVVAANDQDVAKDLVVYENVIALVSSGDAHNQVNVGTLVKVGDSWRMIGLPNSETTSFFFTPENQNHITTTVAAGTQGNSKLQSLIQQLEALDSKLAQASSPAGISRLNRDRSNILRSLVNNTTGKDKELWILQLVDAVSTAAQSGHFDGGAKELKDLNRDIAKLTKNREVLAQTKYAYLTTDYTLQLQKPKADYAKIQEQWLKNLDDFVAEFKRTPQAADAMLQLAIAEEFAGNTNKALVWYKTISRDHADSDLAVKANGARRRLDSIGKSIPIKGKTLNGRSIDLSNFRGNYVVVHYWATWCEPCKEDMKTLRDLQAKFARKNFAVVGINLDNDRKDAIRYANANRIKWPQIYDAGGLESDAAKSMGIFTLPVMLVVDKNGTVMNRSVTAGEIEPLLKSRLKNRR